MSQGTVIKTIVNNLITTYGSTVTITPRSPTKGDYGGYEAVTDNESTVVSTLGIPSNYLERMGLRKFGDLKEGECAILIKSSETVDQNDKITWQSDNYDVREIKRIPLQNVILAIRLVLSRRLD